jgi:hypothetical protein
LRRLNSRGLSKIPTTIIVVAILIVGITASLAFLNVTGSKESSLNPNAAASAMNNSITSSRTYDSSNTSSVNTHVSSTSVNNAITTTTSVVTGSSSSASASASSSCIVLKTIIHNGVALGVFSNGGMTLFVSFNFTSSTLAKNFTLAGSFTSKANYTMGITYYNSTNTKDFGTTITLVPTLDSNGNYNLTVHQVLPIDTTYNDYTIGVSNHSPAGSAPGERGTSDFDIITCQRAQLQTYGFETNNGQS